MEGAARKADKEGSDCGDETLGKNGEPCPLASYLSMFMDRKSEADEVT
jgi:hypothetical protein